jgi:hypothetical protein
MSIEQQTMQQIPSGCNSPMDPTKIQLAFGHRYKAAYQWLKDHGKTGNEPMPINLEEMTDEKILVPWSLRMGSTKISTPSKKSAPCWSTKTSLAKTVNKLVNYFT